MKKQASLRRFSFVTLALSVFKGDKIKLLTLCMRVTKFIEKDMGVEK